MIFSDQVLNIIMGYAATGKQMNRKNLFKQWQVIQKFNLPVL